MTNSLILEIFDIIVLLMITVLVLKFVEGIAKLIALFLIVSVILFLGFGIKIDLSTVYENSETAINEVNSKYPIIGEIKDYLIGGIDNIINIIKGNNLLQNI